MYEESVRRDHTISITSSLSIHPHPPAIYGYLRLSQQQRALSLSQQRALSLSTRPHHFAPFYTSYISSHTTLSLGIPLYVSSYYYICVRILLNMCPDTGDAGCSRRPSI